MQTSKKVRQKYVDIMKAFCIIGVVMLHITDKLPKIDYLPIKDMLSQWSVILFFVISGFFIKEKSLINPKHFIGSKFKALYLPGFLAMLLCFSLHNLFFNLGWYDVNFPYQGNWYNLPYPPQQLSDYKIVLIQLLILSGDPYFGPVWFLEALFEAFLGYVIIFNIINKFNRSHYSNQNIFIGVLLLLSSLMYVFQEKLGLFIPRVNIVFSVILLINIGFIVNNI